MQVEVRIPSPGESISEVTVAAWLKQDGAQVRQDEDLLEIESEKATLAVPAEAAGRLKILVQEGEDVAVGEVVCTIDTEAAGEEAAAAEPAAAAEEPAPQPEEAPAAASGPTGSMASVASPAAAKMLAEAGLAVQEVKGSGPGGRVTKQDVLAHQAAAPAKPASKVETNEARPEAAAAPVAKEGERGLRREKMSRLRQKLSQRLVAVKNQTAMLSTFNEVDMSAILDLRRKYKETFKETHDVGLGFMSFFTKAVTLALAEVPAVNAAIDGEEILYHDYCDIGIAVSAPKGLVVPVVRDAQSMSLWQIEAEIRSLAEKARNNRLSMDEMSGGTFTISNGGVFGSMMSTPILNPPQCGILGMHNIVERPVAIEGRVEIRPMMYLTLSYDHRLIDGRESVTFLVKVKERLEDPMRMLLMV